MSTVQALGRLKHRDLEFEASLGYIVSSRPGWALKKDFVAKTKQKHAI